MSPTHQDQDKSGKPRQRGRKADRRGQKSGQPQTPRPEPQGEDQIDLMAAATEVAATEVAPTEVVTPAAAAPADVPLIGEILPPEVSAIGAAPIGVQAIANAYADYGMRSFEQRRSFVDKLIGV